MVSQVEITIHSVRRGRQFRVLMLVSYNFFLGRSHCRGVELSSRNHFYFTQHTNKDFAGQRLCPKHLLVPVQQRRSGYAVQKVRATPPESVTILLWIDMLDHSNCGYRPAAKGIHCVPLPSGFYYYYYYYLSLKSAQAKRLSSVD